MRNIIVGLLVAGFMFLMFAVASNIYAVKTVIIDPSGNSLDTMIAYPYQYLTVYLVIAGAVCLLFAYIETWRKSV
jgi:hypothetical protein